MSPKENAASSSSQPAQANPPGNHVFATGAASPPAEPAAKRMKQIEKAKMQQLSRQLQMRLQYARLKVDHGWTRQNLNEVENLYFHHYRSRPSPPLPQARGHGRGQSKASHSHQSQSQSQPEQRWAVPSGPSRTANPPSSVQSYPSPPQPDVRSDSPSTQSRPHPPSSPFTFSPPQTHQSRTTAASSAPLSPPLSIGHTPVAFPSTASASNPRAAHSYNPSRASPTATAPATSSSTTTTSATGLNPPLTYDSFWSSLSSPSKLSALSSATAVLASSGSSLRKGSD